MTYFLIKLSKQNTYIMAVKIAPTKQLIRLTEVLSYSHMFLGFVPAHSRTAIEAILLKYLQKIIL
jgi:hypothetical protein